jgi:hypothetical protein
LVLGELLLAEGPRTNNAAPQEPQTPVTGQSTESTSAQANASPRLAPGSVLPVELTKGVDAKKAKPGDPVEVKVTQDLKAQDGSILVSKDTKVIGHVTEAQARNKEQKESQVGIAFDHLVLKDGGEVPLPVSIQAIIGPSNSNSDSNNSTGQGAGQPASVPRSGGMPSGSSGDRSSSGAGMSPQTSVPTGNTDRSANNQAGGNGHAPITADTQGVVGISNLKLSTGPSAAQGSVVSSEKGNVKLDSGTFMLLRVNQ